MGKGQATNLWMNEWIKGSVAQSVGQFIIMVII